MNDRFSPLSGIRVVDLSKVLAGPLCTQYLGDLGADVIKIEPCSGDDTRAWPPFSGRDGAVYLSVNKNKRSLAIDLKTEAGKRVVQSLIANADVLVESFRTGVAQRLGIDYETTKKLKPDLIYASISGFGRSGPLAMEPGYDMMIQAFSGIMSITGEKDGGPVRSAFSPLDQTTGIHTALGILAALRHREQTGQGQLIEASLYETALSFLGYPSQIYWTSGLLPKRLGSGHESVCPYQAFQASDGYILIAVGNDQLWKKLCAVLGYEELADDPRYATNAARVENFDKTVELVAAKVRKQTAKECAARLSEAGVPNSLLHDIEQSLNHPQAEARGMISKLPHPATGEINALSMPLLFEGYNRKPRTAPPMLGEHSVEVLEEAGLKGPEIDSLLRDGTVLTAD